MTSNENLLQPNTHESVGTDIPLANFGRVSTLFFPETGEKYPDLR